MRNQLLHDLDGAGMAHSLEVRTPFVDVPLWETATRLALGGYAAGKHEMAQSPAVPLPAAILNRPKTGFSIPVREWLRSSTSVNVFPAARGLRGWASLLDTRAGLSELMAA